MARFRTFAEAVAYYQREQGLTREKAINRALHRCPSLVKKMARQVTEEARRAAKRVDATPHPFAGLEQLAAAIDDEVARRRAAGLH